MARLFVLAMRSLSGRGDLNSGPHGPEPCAHFRDAYTTLQRVRQDQVFAQNFEVSCTEFKTGIVLRQTREKKGLTWAEVARRLHTSKSVISRIENHAGEVRLSTLRRYAEAIGSESDLPPVW